MKKLLTYLTIALSLIIGFGINAKAEPSSSQIVVSLNEDGRDKPEENPWGLRIPAVPLTSTIDFDALSIISDRLPMVLSYELWDESGDTMLVSYSNDFDMVSFMSSLTGCYQLRLLSADSTYLGYIEL